MTKRAPLGKAASGARQGLYELIESGVFPPGQKLPGERELAERLSISRTVLRHALASLADEGRLENSPWRGWFVTSPHMAEKINLQSFTEMARSRGLVPGAHVVERATRAATLEESAALAIAPASEVHEVHRLRTLDRVPTCYDVTVMPVARLGGIVMVDLEDASLYAMLEEVSGVRVVRTDYVMRADAAPPDIADALRTTPGAPVLIGEETAYDVSGTPVLLGRVTYRHDAYNFQATLWRPYDEAQS